MSIPNHTLDQLNSQADLVGIIGKHTTLKRAGKEFKGNCPFHGEKTPSFYVNPRKNVYNCFGCGVGGNAISFLRDYENLTFMEAVQELSRQTGIEIPKEDTRELQYKRHTKPVQPQQPANNQRAQNQTQAQNRAQSQTQKQAQNQSPAQGQSQNQQNNTTNTGANSNNPDNAPNSANQSTAPQSGSEQFVPVDEGYYDGSMYISESDYLDTGMPPIWSDAEIDPNFDPSAPYFDPTGGTAVDIAPQGPQEGNLYDLLINVAQFYQHNLYNNSLALSYFQERGLSDKTIQEFGLGYAPRGWQHLEEAFPHDIEGLKALGLVRRSEKGRDYDLLRDRVIFPIRDNQGRVIGFAGRALDNEVKPKYINSSDSPVFHKQHVLYGYYESRQHRANDWLVVEGYMDVIALYQAGIYGAVASMGTSINETQIARLLQLNPTLTLCFDGDGAGQKAAWRTLEVALPVLSDDKELRFLSLPGGHDPDTYIAMQGVDAMREQIQRAMPLSQYVFAYLSERYDLTTAEGKAKLMSQVRQLTNNLPKGSSFKYLLNNDIYQKLGGRKGQKHAAHDVLLNFDSDLTVSRQLELCLLFAPTLLQPDPIERLWEESGVAAIRPNRSKKHMQQPVQLPALPSWQDLNNPSLLQLVQVIKRLLPYLPKDTNAAAHFIMANLPSQVQQTLAKRWYSFWSNLNQRGIIDVDELVDDLLAQLMLQALSKKISQSRSVLITDHLNKQRQALANWLKQQQAEQSSKLDA